MVRRLLSLVIIVSYLTRIASAELIVHEWGTFTSLHDEAGRTIDGINTDDEPLPPFVHNMLPGNTIPLSQGYRIGVPKAGEYTELFNSDAETYGGGNKGNGTGLRSEATAWMEHAQSLLITLPPLACLILQPIG